MASGINAYFSRAAPNDRWRADSSSYTAEINVRMTISVATVYIYIYAVRYKQHKSVYGRVRVRYKPTVGSWIHLNIWFAPFVIRERERSVTGVFNLSVFHRELEDSLLCDTCVCIHVHVYTYIYAGHPRDFFEPSTVKESRHPFNL